MSTVFTPCPVIPLHSPTASFPLKFMSSFLVIVYNLFNYKPSPNKFIYVSHIYLLFMAHYLGLVIYLGICPRRKQSPTLRG